MYQPVGCLNGGRGTSSKHVTGISMEKIQFRHFCQARITWCSVVPSCFNDNAEGYNNPLILQLINLKFYIGIVSRQTFDNVQKLQIFR